LEHWSYAHPTAPTLPSKRELQRPRPHQVASLHGLAFEVQRAPGAVTSATPSGHAIQGLMGVAGAIVELRRYHRFDAPLLSRLRQYAVDVGDRRVFAGVHFPTDNLASWCLALSLCSHVYGQDGDFARAFMAEAITRHSAVHAALAASGSPLLAPGLDWLKELL
jgi:membrane-associated phospholipid phosphatase